MNVLDLIARLEEAISAARLQLLARQHNVPEEQVELVSQADPTDGKYTPWILKQCLAGHCEFPRNQEQMFQLLKKFAVLSRKPAWEGEKDINRLTIRDLEQLVSNNAGISTKKEKRRDLAVAGCELLVRFGPYAIYSLTTEEAAAKVARHTDWCIKDPKYFRQYVTRNVTGDLSSLFLMTTTEGTDDPSVPPPVSAEDGEMDTVWPYYPGHDNPYRLLSISAGQCCDRNDKKLGPDAAAEFFGPDRLDRNLIRREVRISGSNAAAIVVAICKRTGRWPEMESDQIFHGFGTKFAYQYYKATIGKGPFEIIDKIFLMDYPYNAGGEDGELALEYIRLSRPDTEWAEFEAEAEAYFTGGNSRFRPFEIEYALSNRSSAWPALEQWMLDIASTPHNTKSAGGVWGIHTHDWLVFIKLVNRYVQYFRDGGLDDWPEMKQALSWYNDHVTYLAKVTASWPDDTWEVLMAQCSRNDDPRAEHAFTMTLYDPDPDIPGKVEVVYRATFNKPSDSIHDHVFRVLGDMDVRKAVNKHFGVMQGSEGYWGLQLDVKELKDTRSAGA